MDIPEQQARIDSDETIVCEFCGYRCSIQTIESHLRDCFHNHENDDEEEFDNDELEFGSGMSPEDKF
jgi:hypothetical protein